MTEAYPVALKLAGRSCLVVGGGRVAVRKVERLLSAGAAVTIVAPHLDPRLTPQADDGTVRWLPRGFRDEDLEGAALVFAATDDPNVNARVARVARARGGWVNRADAPEDCDFFVPASARRDGVTVTVSTGGVSPAVAVWLRTQLAAELPAGLERLLTLMGYLRGMQAEIECAPAAFRQLLESGVDRDLAAGDWDAANRKVAHVCGREDLLPDILAREQKGI